MARVGEIVSGILLICGGAAAAALAAKSSRTRLEALEGAVRTLEARVDGEALKTAEVVSAVERRLDTHESRFAEAPGLRDLVTVVDELLDNRMRSIDARLNMHLHSIELVRAAVSQTDDLIARLLAALEPVNERDYEADALAGVR